MGLLKKLARRVLRSELSEAAAIQEITSRKLERFRGDLWNTEGRLKTAQRQLLDLRRACGNMEPWVREHAAGDIRLLAWAQLLGNNADPCGFGIVHPFDRWGISPKP